MSHSTPRKDDLQTGKGSQSFGHPSHDPDQILADLRAEKLSLINSFPSSTGRVPSETDQEREARVMREAKAAIQAHTVALGKYNDVRDTCQNLIGILAERRGVRIVDVMKELDITDDG